MTKLKFSIKFKELLKRWYSIQQKNVDFFYFNRTHTTYASGGIWENNVLFYFVSLIQLCSKAVSELIS